MPKIHFSQKSIDSLPIPQVGRIIYSDMATRFLSLIATSTGGKSYYYIRKHAGKTIFDKIADAGEISLREIQKEVARRTVAIDRGEQTTPATQAKCPSLEKVITDWLEAKRIRGDKTRNINDTISRLKKYLPAGMFLRSIDAISKAELQKIYLDTIVSVGKTTARRIIVDLRAAINYAINLEYPIQRNPAAKLDLLPQEERDRYIKPAEVEQFFAALIESSSQDFIDFVCIALFTSKRSGNVESMRWEHIDLSGKSWSIPRTMHKNKAPDIAVLDDIVVAILRRRKATQENAGSKTPYVFASPRSALGHYREPKTSWRNLLIRAKLDDLRIHDLRRTLASWMANRNTSLHMIANVLGQKSLGATPIYARIATDPKRAAVAGAVSDLLRAGGVQATRAGLVRDERHELRQQLHRAIEQDPEFEALALQCWREYKARPEDFPAAPNGCSKLTSVTRYRTSTKSPRENKVVPG